MQHKNYENVEGMQLDMIIMIEKLKRDVRYDPSTILILK